MHLIRANSREPDRLEGDIYALVASNETGAERLKRMMEEYRLSDLKGLSEYILQTSDRSMLEAIGKLPKGSWKHSMRIDGFDTPLDLVARLTIEDDIIRVDYTGTSKLSKFGINCPMCYTDAYTSFGVKCLVAPRLANNAAVLSRIEVTAPDNCVTNALFPAPVTARALIGHMLPDLVFGCFDQAIPGKVPAEGTGSSWSLRLGAAPASPGTTMASPRPSCRKFSKRRDGRTPETGWSVRHTLPFRRQIHRHRNHRGAHALGRLEEGAAPGFRRRRTQPGRSRPGDGNRQPRGRALSPFLPVFNGLNIRRAGVAAG